MDAALLAPHFEAALAYGPYVQTGNPDQQQRWSSFLKLAHLTSAQTNLIAGFVRNMKVLVVSGIWCGDCVQQCPLLQRIAEANPERIDLRFVDRDVHRTLSDQLRINGGDRVPVVLFLSEDGELCSVYGDRTLTRYRALATRQLGPSCPTGVVPPSGDEVSATLADWLGEFERVQLMLRLSGRLRQKYGD